jgi:hypothetical protein
MQTSGKFKAGKWLYLAAGLVASAALMSVTGCGLMMHGAGAERPLTSEFGLGPRQSAQGLYTATLVPAEELRPGTMQRLQVELEDGTGTAINGATIAIDGGMPEHGHGLPTRPRVTANSGDGIYDIEGVRFNMGGWWEFKLAVATPAGDDTVTFNIEL